MISGSFLSVSNSKSSGGTSSPLAKSKRKWRLGWVKPRSSLEIELTSQPHLVAKSTCEADFSFRSRFNARPNASSVLKRVYYLTLDRKNIGTYSYSMAHPSSTIQLLDKSQTANRRILAVSALLMACRDDATLEAGELRTVAQLIRIEAEIMRDSLEAFSQLDVASDNSTE